VSDVVGISSKGDIRGWFYGTSGSGRSLGVVLAQGIELGMFTEKVAFAEKTAEPLRVRVNWRLEGLGWFSKWNGGTAFTSSESKPAVDPSGSEGMAPIVQLKQVTDIISVNI
jgi:hypothetical protein